ncbi:amidase domain-containing protein [Clostridium sp.]|jgi:hypothetical protein|uniref:amidase domain-containing protein n=1 Tax=Clostridium sp. TaxID=1506 RepID=UPI003A5C3CD1
MNKDKLHYSRSKALHYALKYAITPNPLYRYFSIHGKGGGDCTNFTSQCLKSGGAPAVSSGKNQWWYKNNNCSISWAVASSLYWYLKINAKDHLYGVKGYEVNSPALLEVGDIIFYENIKRKIQHSVIVTSIHGSYPFISQHTPNLLNIPYEKNWAYKTHFMKISL